MAILRPVVPVTDFHQSEILRLWRKGFNTFDIALQLHLTEHVVANRLPELRERYRMMTGGGCK